MTPRIGSACSGYGGLELGLIAAIGGSVAWHVEHDKHPSAVLDVRFPGVPNYGDVKTTDWTAVEPVDWFTAGYPCQPFSGAGLRLGEADERHLWPHVADAIRVLRPRRCLLENVAGHLSLGFGSVLGDLAALGYECRWLCLRAADAGAPHNRARVFIVAADTRRERHGRGEDGRSLGRVDRANAGEASQREWTRPIAGDRGSAALSDATGDGRHEGWPEPARLVGRPDAAQRGHAVPDPDSRRRLEHHAGQRPVSVLDAHRGAAADTECGRLPRSLQPRERAQPRTAPAGHCESTCRVSGDWRTAAGDDYGPAVRRWHDLTRCVPSPTEVGPKGGRRLSPLFDEWLMGLPAGWVTDVLPRNPALKALGNGVVPQQAALAVRTLLNVGSVAA